MNDDRKEHYVDDNDAPNKNNVGEAQQETSAEVLLRLVSESAMVFFKDQYKVPYALVRRNGHKEILRVESSTFKRYLAKL